MRSLFFIFDNGVIGMIRAMAVPMGRIALFTVFFWFGFLKLIGTSPANALVREFLGGTMPFWPFESFAVVLGVWEMLIGIAFLVAGWERFAVALLLPHMATTFLPLFFLPETTWQGFLTPTLEGQYIIKNIVIIALALGIASHLHPMPHNPEKR